VYTELVTSCTSTLELLRRKLDSVLIEETPAHFAPQNTRMNAVVTALSQATKASSRRLRWPFSREEVKSIMDRLEKYKSTFALALSVDSVPALFKILGQQQKMLQTISNIRMTQNEERMRRIRKEQRDILISFSPVDPVNRRIQLLSERHKGTGLWFTESDYFKDFLRHPGSGLWLHGIPGRESQR
jgi:hypothetical protein